MVTSNAHKAMEVAAFFKGALDVAHVALEIPEHRSDDVGEIAKGKAQYAYARLQTPLIVDDTGFSVDALNGFPGPYAAYVLHTLGNPGILKLMDGVKNRKAHFTTAIAYADNTEIRVFTGTIQGTVTTSPRGNNGFGYDPIVDIDGRTLAEMSLTEKGVISHRAKALISFRDWFCEKKRSGPVDTNG
jgi:XTP/dITP diphosphohydrolase